MTAEHNQSSPVPERNRPNSCRNTWTCSRSDRSGSGGLGLKTHRSPNAVRFARSAHRRDFISSTVQVAQIQIQIRAHGCGRSDKRDHRDADFWQLNRAFSLRNTVIIIRSPRETKNWTCAASTAVQRTDLDSRSSFMTNRPAGAVLFASSARAPNVVGWAEIG